MRKSTPIVYQANFDEGDVVWAKLQGFSWWPARVFRSQDSANTFVGRSLTFPNTRRQRVCFVFFLVTEDTTVLSPDRAIRPFKPWAAQLAAVKQSARFQDAFDRAVRAGAIAHNCLNIMPRLRNFKEEEEEEEEEDEEEDEEDEEEEDEEEEDGRTDLD